MLQETTKLEIKKGLYFKCKKCGDEIYHNTNMWPLTCSCGCLAIQCDGNIIIGHGDPAHVEAFERYGENNEKTRAFTIKMEEE